MSRFALLERPAPFSPGTITLWSNEHIASNVLTRHLDFSVDSGSRKLYTIQQTVNWITQKFPGDLKICDIGCGPGLYGPALCSKGYIYHGIDVSPFQIEYAIRNHYIHGKTFYEIQDFRNWKITEQYDIALMLYGIYSFYPPAERVSFLKRMKKRINPDGCVIAEVFTKEHYKNRSELRDWEYFDQGGFWCGEPYLELNAFLRYDELSLVLIQAAMMREDSLDVWNSWIQTFDPVSITREFEQAGFTRFEYFGSCSGGIMREDSEVLCICAF